jgi:beta-lactamase regulating signal transducer with metallopeptidase domain
MNSVVETLNQSGTRLADFAVPMLVQSSLFIVLLFALDLVLRNRVRAVVRYGLWMLVLIKLVFPPSFAAPTSLAYWLPQEKAVKAPPAPSPQFVVGYSDVKFDEARPLPSLPPPRAKLQFAAWLLLGWLTTALVLMAWLVRRSRSVIQTASQALPATDSPEQLLGACRQQMGIRQQLRLKLSATASSPAVCGLWRPVILIPQSLADKLSALQLRAVLLHELAHIKRGDVWVHHAQTLLQIIYWWHPLLWLANAQIRRVREQAVDEAVVVAMGSEAEAYPATLLEVAKLALERPMLALGLIGIVESKSALAQRIQHLLDHPIPKSARFGFAGLVTVFLTGAALLPMARAQRAARVDTRNVPSSSSGRTAAVNPPAAEAGESSEVVSDANAWARTFACGEIRLTLDANGSYLASVEENGVSRRETGNWKKRGREFILERETGDLPYAIRRLRVDERHPTHLLWVYPTSDFNLFGAIEYSSFKPADETPEPNSLKSQLTNTVTTSEGPRATKKFVLSTGQEIEIEATKPSEIQYYPETGICIVTNDFVVRFKDAVLTAQRGQINTKTGEVIAEGGFTLQRGDQVFSGERLQYNFIHQKITRADAPKGESEQLTVTIDKSGNLYLGSKRVTTEELKTQLQSAARRDPVLSIRADQEAPFGEIVKVMDAAKETGIEAVNAITQSRRDKIPVLGDIPFLGRSFRSEAKGSRGVGEIQSALNQIILPQVAFDNMRLPDVLRWLSNQTREHGPSGRGIDFVIGSGVAIRTAEQTAMVPTTVDPITGKLITLPSPEPVDLNTVIVRINPPLRNVRLADAVEAIAKVADKPIRYSIEDYGIVFSPKPPETTQLETRVFRLNPDLFLENLRKQMVGEVSTNVVDLVRRFFEGAGVSVFPPNTIFYGDRKGLLMVRATAKELNIVQNALELLNHSPSQITIKAKFVEVGGNAKALGFDWFLGNVLQNGNMPGWPPGVTPNGTNNLVGILTTSQVKIVFKALEQRAGADILSAPQVTTLSGRQTEISVTQATEVNGNAIQTGPVLDILPFVSDDGFTLSVDASATVTDVLGNEADRRVLTTNLQGKASRFSASSSAPGMRRVRTRRVQGKVVVYDGQTLVLGNPIVSVISRQPDGQSATNAVPEDAGKRLLVFITPTIIDPAGNPIHAPGKEPFPVDKVPPQPPR